MDNSDRIQPYAKNPRYWQYKGQPVLLIGGSADDNLFQISGLEEHLDLLASVGGNYIRNTMSSRDPGNLQPFQKTAAGYDLDRWNDAYWEKFEKLLELTGKRDIIVQVEIWAIWDMFYERWEASPWNPANNINYRFGETRLKDSYGNPGVRPYKDSVMHDFYFSPPGLSHDPVLLTYQQRFVDKILSHSLKYGHVLYCMTNEIFIQFDPEWGWYWAKYIKDAAADKDKLVCVSEMYQYPVIRAEQHKASLDHPEIFDFVDLSQNSGRYGVGENHWDNFRYAYRYISDHPRPINHVKTYGGERQGPEGPRLAREKFLRSLVGGTAAIRFHRPPSGLGLNKQVQATLTMIRDIESHARFWDLEPRQDLLSSRESDEAYLAVSPGGVCLLYFTEGGSVEADLSGFPTGMRLIWYNVHTGRREYALPWQGGRPGVKISAPGGGGWIAVLVPEDHQTDSISRSKTRGM